MNSRQWRLYEYLKYRYSVNPNEHVSTWEICKDLSNDYHLEVKDANAHDSAAYVLIRNDINFMRKHPEEHMKVIVSSSKGYKIATESEANEWLEKVKNEAVAKFSIYWKNLKMAETNKQMRIVFNQEKQCVEIFQN